MPASFSYRWKGTLFYLATMAGVLGQVAAPSQTTPQPSSLSSVEPVAQSQSNLQAFQQEQRTLMQQERVLAAQGATQEQLEAWQQQNASQFALQQQRAQAMAAAAALQPSRTNRQPRIPANASQTLKDFLTTRAVLANARAKIHNQLIQSMPLSASASQVSQMEHNEMQTFEQQYAAELQLQAQRAQTLANEAAQIPLPVPRPLQLPANATPQQAAYLTLRYQLRQERVQLWNQYVNADPNVRQSAMNQWFQQNASQFTQLRQLAQSLSQTSLSTQN